MYLWELLTVDLQASCSVAFQSFLMFTFLSVGLQITVTCVNRPITKMVPLNHYHALKKRL